MYINNITTMPIYAYPGTFSPPTKGHAAIVRRAAAILPHITIVCSTNDSKNDRWFSPEEVRALWASYGLPENVSIATFDELAAMRTKPIIMIRGIRDQADYEYEKAVMKLNHETFGINSFFYLIAEPEYAHISSSHVRALTRAFQWGRLADYVSPAVIEALKKKSSVPHKRTMTNKAEKKLRKRWLRFFINSGFCMARHTRKERRRAAIRAFERMRRQYKTPQRFYHTLEGHIADCLTEFDKVRCRARHPYAVEAAIWLHDAHYDTHRHDNEERSARLARKILNGRSSDTTHTEDLILFTKRHASPRSIDEKILSDIDLAILGAPQKTFVRYEQNIRREYAWIPEKAFCERRREILQKFLKRKNIYHLDVFRKKYEKRARHNIRRSIRKLRKKSLL